jgi:hypothetical protein
MFRRWFLLPFLAGVLLAPILLAVPEAALAGPKDKKAPEPKGGKDKKGPEPKAAKDLNKAYDTLTEVSLAQSGAKEKLPRDLAKLFDQARDYYRSAVRSFEDGDTSRAGELAKAANDAGRGLKHWLRANGPAVPGLPAPPVEPGPPGPAAAEPWEGTRQLLQRARDRITEVEGLNRDGPGQPFLEASRDAYQRARRAYLDKEYARAAELARGAEAWTHVGEHLQRSGRGLVIQPEKAPAKPGNVPPPPPPPLE